MELTLPIIWSCLMRVPVRHWRTLFHYLGRLDAAFAEARGDSRTFVTCSRQGANRTSPLSS
ncbi:MAG: hypothetical protein CME84_10420 [Henriciella sp.]|jgi:hypothetical protein|nr:hypothetical protein [Henriciella sp.]PHR81404.1 MAG: hypothetical protein COA64_02675 [Henriciella sp.]